MQEGAKKSLYIFLSCIMGVLLFLVLHRVIFFFWLILQVADFEFFGSKISYFEGLAIEYTTLIITLFCGAWYGIWVGEYWYRKVYEERNHRGFFSHVMSRYFVFRHNPENLAVKIEKLSKTMEVEAKQVTVLTKDLSKELQKPMPIKRVLPKKPSVAKRKVSKK